MGFPAGGTCVIIKKRSEQRLQMSARSRGMARYHFESRLTPEQIKVRMSAFAKPTAFGWRLGESAFYYRFYREAAFFLIKTRSGRWGGTAMNQPVFLGKLTEKDGVTAIDGRFGWRGDHAVPWLLPAVMFFLFHPPVIVPIVVWVWLWLCSRLVLAVSSSLYK